jgi:hypothetical protein
MPVVLIVSGQWDLRGAVRAELREAGIEALGLETVDEMGRMIARGVAPSLMVVDGAQLYEPKTRAAVENVSSRVPVLVIDSGLNPAPELADAETMRRPVRVQEIVSRVLEMLSAPPS